MNVLTVQNLCKTYPAFQLKDVSFQMEEGTIMGFIGRNGAGKTTTLKSLLNIVHPDSGTIRFFGEDFNEREQAIKQQVAFALGGVNYYQRKKIKSITGVYKQFYRGWRNDLYRSYLDRFGLDEKKKVVELSQGMKVKYELTLALSHGARLLMLDEPTSGLDPVSRDDLLELFLDLVEAGQTSILFSTHLTSDLEKCADTITYIKEGRILSSQPMKEMVDSYRLIRGKSENLTKEAEAKLIGCRSRGGEFSALISTAETEDLTGVELSSADLESIMVYIERE